MEKMVIPALSRIFKVTEFQHWTILPEGSFEWREMNQIPCLDLQVLDRLVPWWNFISRMWRHTSRSQKIWMLSTCTNPACLMTHKYQLFFNPIWPSLFWCIRTLNIFGMGGVRVPILFGNDLPMHDFPYSKGFIKFGCQEPSKKYLTFETFVRQKGVWPSS